MFDLRGRGFDASATLSWLHEETGDALPRIPLPQMARHGGQPREVAADPTETEDRDLIRNHVLRVEVQADQLVVELKAEKASSDSPNAVDHDRLVLRVPWKKTPIKRRRDIIVPASVSPHDRRPIRAETRRIHRFRAPRIFRRVGSGLAICAGNWLIRNQVPTLVQTDRACGAVLPPWHAGCRVIHS